MKKSFFLLIFIVLPLIGYSESREERIITNLYDNLFLSQSPSFYFEDVASDYCTPNFIKYIISQNEFDISEAGPYYSVKWEFVPELGNDDICANCRINKITALGSGWYEVEYIFDETCYGGDLDFHKRYIRFVKSKGKMKIDQISDKYPTKRR